MCFLTFEGPTLLLFRFMIVARGESYGGMAMPLQLVNCITQSFVLLSHLLKHTLKLLFSRPVSLLLLGVSVRDGFFRCIYSVSSSYVSSVDHGGACEIYWLHGGCQNVLIHR